MSFALTFLKPLYAHGRHLDAAASMQAGIASLMLMEHAGFAVAQAARQMAPSCLHWMIICGTGHNGGDGMVAARLLSRMPNTRVSVLLLGQPEQLPADSLANWNRLDWEPTVQTIIEPDIHEWACDIFNASGVIDAIFGVGLNRPVEAPFSSWIEAINRRKGQGVLAIDMPSGVCSKTGQILGCAVQAERTLTLATGKPGLYLSGGKFQAAHLSTADIGIPEAILKQFPPDLWVITDTWVNHRLPQPAPSAHKGNRGHVMVIGGSRAMPGAPQLSAMAALTSGCGLVSLAMAEAAYDTTAALWPELMHIPWNSCDLQQACQTLSQVISERPPQAIVLGPGLGEHADALVSALLAILRRTSKTPLILDADALNALAKLSDSVRLPNHVILTPHIGEAARLLQCCKQEILMDLPKAAQRLQTRWGGVIVLKSATTVVALSSADVVVNPTGACVLATAGSGDVLAGVIASFAAQGCAPDDAALIGSYLHGRAGEMVAEKMSGYGVRAKYVIEMLPKALAHSKALTPRQGLENQASYR
ncbi:MAG: NAD(P)H-hydrate dehydratase [Vampirovibrionales bacterium]|nr:NAD(P)H-hydrate dehydratase [Vampirovibrionales bacterium]